MSEVPAVSAASLERKETRRRSFLVDLIIRLVREKPLGTVGGIIVLLLLFAGIFADLLAPYGMNESHLDATFQPPSSQYWLGTDNLGRDFLSRIIFGARISVIVGVCAAALDVLVSTLIGVLSGYFGSKTDIVIQRFVDAWMCFPSIFLLLTIMALLGPGLFQVILVLGVSSGIRGSRVVRSAVIGIKRNIFIEAATAIGAPTRQIVLRHILPNIMAPIIIIFSLSMGASILAESTLSFLGFGIPPPAPSWGGMLSSEGRYYMNTAPWMAIWPGLALSIVVYGTNMLGDALRDLLDPRLRGGLGRYGGAEKKRQKLIKKKRIETESPGVAR
jgi:peptide/nickel transport system permease protein